MIDKSRHEWRDQAACRGTNTEDWFCEKLEARCLRVCASCPVRQQCLDDAMRTEHGQEAWGVRGGRTAATRMLMDAGMPDWGLPISGWEADSVEAVVSCLDASVKTATISRATGLSGRAIAYERSLLD